MAKEGIRADSVRCDFAKPVDIDALAKDVQAKFGRLDVVLHMASICYEAHDLFACRPLRLHGEERTWMPM